MVKKKPKLQNSQEVGEGSSEGDGANKPKQVSFKNPIFLANRTATTKKSKGFKSLKQIITSEKPHPSGVTYGGIDAPPSQRPREKFSDLSGIQANYTDPLTRLHYCDADEFTQLRLLDEDVANGYLDLRKVSG